MTNLTPARGQGAPPYEIVERRVYGAEDYVAGVVDQLSEHGMLINATAMRYDSRGSYAVVVFRKPHGVLVDGATPVRPRPAGQVAVRQLTAAPAAAATGRRWPRPAIVAAVVLVVLALLAALGFWIISAISRAAVINGGGLLVIAGIVWFVAWVRSGSGGGHGGGSGGYGFHWGRCE